MRQLFGILLMLELIFMGSCSSIKMADENDQNLVEETQSSSLTDTDRSVGMIVGSSKIANPENFPKKTYFLYGAEHLHLENYYFDIPVVYNNEVKSWIKYFLNNGRQVFQRYGARAGRYAPLMGKILEEHGLPRDLIFVAMAESGFQNKAKSWALAVGPWQFMPYTGKRFGLKIDWYIDERRDPIKSTIAAAKYLTKLYEDFGAWELAAAAYNAGEGKMLRAINRYNTENFWKLSQGRYLKRETKNYVPKIMALAIIGKNLKCFGFEDIDFHDPLDFEEIKIAPLTDLMALAEELDVDFEEIHYLNPEIMRWFSPPDQAYMLRVPVGVSKKWESCCQDKDLVATDFQKYRIRGSRTTLKDVAKKFKVQSYVLEQFNGIKDSVFLSQNRQIVLPFREGQSTRDPMYSDLYDRPRKSVLARRDYQSRIKRARSKGMRISNPQEYYTVQRGDTLWAVAQKTGVSLDTLIKSNLQLVRNRMIREGDKLVVR